MKRRDDDQKGHCSTRKSSSQCHDVRVYEGLRKNMKINLKEKIRKRLFFNRYFQQPEIEPQTTVSGQLADRRDRSGKQKIPKPVSQSEKASAF